MKKSFFPDPEYIFIGLLIALIFFGFYGETWPEDWVFAKTINSSPIGTPVAVLVWIAIITAGGYILAKIAMHYDEWRK